MSIKDFDDIKIPKNIDEAIDKGVLKAMNSKKKSNTNKFLKRGSFMAAGLTGFMVLGFANPAIASKIPFVGSVFEKLEESNDDKDFKKYATAINQKVESNGIGVTISEVLSDGQSIFLTYVIESEKPFPSEAVENKNNSLHHQMMIYPEVEVDFSDKIVPSSTILEGEFIDANTFIGMEKYSLIEIGEDIPEEFILKKSVKYIEGTGIAETYGNKTGIWDFEIAVKVNKDLTKVIEVNQEENEFKVDKLHISEFGMVMEKSYLGMLNKMLPEQDKESIQLFNDDGTEIEYYSESPTKIFLDAPKKESKSIRILVRKAKSAIEKENGVYETQGFEKEPILDIVVPIK